MTARLRRRPDETGETLIEVVMAMAILGVAVVVIVGGIATSILTSDYHRKEAQAQTVLASAADALASQSVNPYKPCASKTDYSPTSGVTLPVGWAASTVSVTVAYWNGAGFGPTCPVPPAVADQKLQLLTVQVQTPDGRATESVQVVKRNPS